MRTFTVETHVRAPRNRCFDLARNIDIHSQISGFAHSAVGGRTSGEIALNEQVQWKATLFGFLPVSHTSRIVEMNPPEYFCDRMESGWFSFYEHCHWFKQENEKTLLRDEVRFSAPFWPVNLVIERVWLEPLLQRLILELHSKIKAVAESTAEAGS